MPCLQRLQRRIERIAEHVEAAAAGVGEALRIIFEPDRLDEPRNLEIGPADELPQAGQRGKGDRAPRPAGRREGRASPAPGEQPDGQHQDQRSPRQAELEPAVLKPMLFHAPVKRSAAEAQFGGGQRDVEMVHPQGPLDHLPFKLVEVEASRHERQRRRLRPGRAAGNRRAGRPSPSAMMTARSAAWRSARTLPGQSCLTSASMTSAGTGRSGRSYLRS